MQPLPTPSDTPADLVLEWESSRITRLHCPHCFAYLMTLMYRPSRLATTRPLKRCRQLLTHPMGATSSTDPVISPLEPGMPRLVLQPASLLRGIPTRSSLLLTLQILLLGFVTTP